MSDPNILNVCPERSKKLYPNKGKFTVEQLLKADMVKSAFNGALVDRTLTCVPSAKRSARAVYRKQSDGTWKVVADMGNSDLPAPVPV